MIDMVPVIGKYWTPGSASAAMGRAIMCHRDVEENERDMVLLKVSTFNSLQRVLTTCSRPIDYKIIYIVWNEYGSFVNMEHQLQELGVPPRVSIQKKLLSIFGVNSEGRITKDLRLARDAMAGVATGKKRATTTTNLKGKGREKGKEVRNRSKKKKMRTDTDDTDDDEEEEEGDDDDDDDDEDNDDDSAWVDSAEDDGEEDRDEDEREARARLRREKTTKKHRAIIARHEEWSETHAVLVGSKGDGREKHTPVLDFNRQPPSFHKPWKKVSRVSKDHTSVPMRGLVLVDWTTWEWKNIQSQSFTRVMRSFAAAAIAESSTIISYRHEMILCNPEGGAATLRLYIQDAVAPYLVERDRTQVMRQTTLKDLLGSASQGSKAGEGLVLTEGNLPPPKCITWADGIYHQHSNDDINNVHFVEDELARLEREKALGSQQRAVQKAINAIQDLRVAWHDPTSTARKRDKPALDENVASALHTLVKVRTAVGLLSLSLSLSLSFADITFMTRN